MRTRLLVAVSIGIAAGCLCWLFLGRLGLGAADFNWAYDAARNLVAHRDPYAGTPTGTIPYPLPAVFYALPFSWLPRGAAAGAFFGVSSALLAFGLAKEGYLRLLMFLSYPYWVAMLTAQWSPLLAAVACTPVLLPITLAKPNIALPVALTSLSRRGVIVTVIIGVVSFVVMPGWLSEWAGQLGGYQHFFPVLVIPGFLLLLAAIRYRDRDARLLLLASLVPQRWFYDAFILWVIPKTRRELVWTIACSWVLGVWRWYHPPTSIAQVGLWTVLWLYLPMLVVVLSRSARTAAPMPADGANEHPPNRRTQL